MSNNWLQEYLLGGERGCDQSWCSTCGGRSLQLWLAFARSTGRDLNGSLDRAGVIDIVKALAGVPFEPRAHDLEKVVRCLLFDLWGVSSIWLHESEPLLAGTWGGDILRRMREHEAARLAAQLEREENDQRRREEKKSVRQEQYHRRLAHQKECSRVWHEIHKPGSEP